MVAAIVLLKQLSSNQSVEKFHAAHGTENTQPICQNRAVDDKQRRIAGQLTVPKAALRDDNLERRDLQDLNVLSQARAFTAIVIIDRLGVCSVHLQYLIVKCR